MCAGEGVVTKWSDTESADHTADHKPRLSFVAVFKKKRDKVAADKEVLKNITVNDEKGENVDQPLDPAESVVYAELDLVAHPQGPAVLVRGDDDKTEYAEIIHTQTHK
ncbi:hypothetical protein J6590_074412 [Homalodisca vitripennis]|nr:hypothetical protein J6590_074412 [Homalodisca vitripennis]